MSLVQPGAPLISREGERRGWYMAGDGVTDMRGVVDVAGPEARDLLQRLVTNDIDTLAAGQARYAALLSPQGKMLVDFLIVAAPLADGTDRFLLDCPAGLAADLTRRLTLYRLRAKVTIVDRSAELTAVPLGAGHNAAAADVVFDDPRSPALGRRAIGPKAALAALAKEADAYRDQRIAARVPEGGIDFPYGDTFPHEANLDRLAGVDFGKGCYVGQEVVSRMQHRSSTRKRVTAFAAPDGLPSSGSEIFAGDLPVGAVGSVTDGGGLALVRLDRVADAGAAGVPLRADGHVIAFELDPTAP